MLSEISENESTANPFREKNNQTQDNESEANENPPLQKPKLTRHKPKIKSEAQIEQFKKLQQKRKENIQKRNLEKKTEAAKLLLESEFLITKKADLNKEEEKAKLTPTGNQSLSNLREEKPKLKTDQVKKAKKKKIIKIVESSDSDTDLDSETETESEEEEDKLSLSNLREIIIQKSKSNNKQFKSQQNKKSIIKVERRNQQDSRNSNKSLAPKNYFVD